MIKIKRDNLKELALAHYKRITVQKENSDQWTLSKHLNNLRSKYPDIDSDEHRMLTELIADTAMVGDDPETSIITALPKTLEKKYVYYKSTYPVLHETQKFKEELKTAFFYGTYAKWGAYELANSLEVNTCPYCNRQSTYTLGTDTATGTRPQFDHYINRKCAPYFSLSFYNLIPSCYICNSNLKHDAFFSIDEYTHPYVDDLTDDVVFSIGPDSIDFIDGKADAYSLVLVRSKFTNKPILETDRALKTYADFRLKDLYENHKDYVDELIQKSRTYTAEYIEGLFDSYKGTLFEKKEDVYRMLLSNYFLVDELEKRPLAKLTRDISKELEFLSNDIAVTYI
jgi:hypothetical protein